MKRVSESAKQKGVSEATVRRAIKDGELPHSVIAGMIVISDENAAAYRVGKRPKRKKMNVVRKNGKVRIKGSVIAERWERLQ